MSALEELQDENNFSNFRWMGNRSLQLEIVPDLVVEFENLRVEIAQMRREMEDARDLARTGLAPDALNMTQEQWAQHKLNKIARDLSHYLETKFVVGE